MSRTQRTISSLICVCLIITAFALLAYAVMNMKALRKGRGTKFVMELAAGSGPLDSDAAIGQAISVLRSRLDALEVTSAVVEREQGQLARIAVLLPPVQNLDRIAAVLIAESGFEVSLIATGTQIPYWTREAAESVARSLPGDEARYRIMLYRDRFTEGGPVQDGWVVVEKTPVITSLDVSDAAARSSESSEGVYEIDLQLNPEGALRLSEATGKHIGEYAAMVFHDEVKSALRIQSQISDRAQITGNFAKEPAQDLALVLRSRALPVSWKLTYISEENISASQWITKYQVMAVVSTLTCLTLLATLYLVNRRRGSADSELHFSR